MWALTQYYFHVLNTYHKSLSLHVSTPNCWNRIRSVYYIFLNAFPSPAKIVCERVGATSQLRGEWQTEQTTEMDRAEYGDEHNHLKPDRSPSMCATVLFAI